MVLELRILFLVSFAASNQKISLLSVSLYLLRKSGEVKAPAGRISGQGESSGWGVVSGRAREDFVGREGSATTRHDTQRGGVARQDGWLREEERLCDETRGKRIF